MNIAIEKHGWVVVTDPKDGGMLKSQSVEAHLLFVIMQQMQEQTEILRSIEQWGTGQQRPL